MDINIYQNENVKDVASRLHAILETAVDGIVIIDERGKVEFVNAAACKLFGYNSDEVVGQSVNMLMPSPHTEQHDRYVNNYLTTGHKRIIGIGREVQGRRKDGTLFPFWLSVSEVVVNEKRMFTGIVHDMTSQKKAEEEIFRLNHELEDRLSENSEKFSELLNRLLAMNQQYQHEIQERKAIEQASYMIREELRQVQELFQNIVDNYPEGSISVVDRHFNYIFTGGEIHSTIGNDARALIGKRLFPQVSDATWAAIQPVLVKAFEGESVRDYEIPEVVKGFSFVFDAFPMRDTSGRVNRIAVFNRNISDLKKVEAELREALKKEKELGQLKSRFVSTASHEFRTPLSTILSSANLMIGYTKEEDQPKRERHYQKIKSAVETLTGILNDFLSLSRLEEGRVEVSAERFVFDEFCSDVVEELNSILKTGQTLTHRHALPPQYEVVLDKKLLKLVLINLISNAAKYSEEHTSILCDIHDADNQLIISIIDQGIGIPEEDKAHMFDRFFRASNALNIKGTGLGLNIVKRYAELMGGNLSFESEMGKGSTFTVSFKKTW